MHNFLEYKSRIKSIWRSAILFGHNEASYKFAKDKTLLELEDKKTNFIYMDDLAESFPGTFQNNLKSMTVYHRNTL